MCIEWNSLHGRKEGSPLGSKRLLWRGRGFLELVSGTNIVDEYNFCVIFSFSYSLDSDLVTRLRLATERIGITAWI